MIDGLNFERKFYLTLYKNRSESPLGKAFRKFIEKNLGLNFTKTDIIDLFPTTVPKRRRRLSQPLPAVALF